jgi:large subunit ribosomal protein L35
MPKLKTHKGAARRMKYSGSGKLMRTRQGKSHLRRNKSKRAAREFDEMFVVAKADLPRLRRLLPYAKFRGRQGRPAAAASVATVDEVKP